MQERQQTKFELFVKSHPFGLRDKFRDALLRRVDPRVTDQTYRNWERGINEPGAQYTATINEVAMEIYGEAIY